MDRFNCFSTVFVPKSCAEVNLYSCRSCWQYELWTKIEKNIDNIHVFLTLIVHFLRFKPPIWFHRLLKHFDYQIVWVGEGEHRDYLQLKNLLSPCFVPISVDYVPLPSLIQSDLFKCKIKRLWECIICIYIDIKTHLIFFFIIDQGRKPFCPRSKRLSTMGKSSMAL